ncbi:MAG: tetratricopeptide repeat protein [Lachnospiraceae bacterium]|nr:tetratricopeptide repeat protein [Lachnospiraceae bacterium]
MKPIAKRSIALLMLLCLLFCNVTPAMADDDDWYTYTYNYWGDPVASPNAYAVTNKIYPQYIDPELGTFSSATSLFCIDDLVFICDAGNNRVIELQKVNGTYELVRIIYSLNVSKLVAPQLKFKDSIDATLYNPMDIFVKPITQADRVANFGTDYLGDPYDFSAETASVTQGNSLTTSDEDNAGEGGEGGESGEGGEGGEGGEDAPTPTPTPVAPSERKENIVRKDLKRDYDFYIADKLHNRVIHCDYNLNVINVIRDPQDDTLGDNYVFNPEHIATDAAYRTYVQAAGVVNGFMEFDKGGSFTGYVGAAKVIVSFWRKLWRKIQTKEQRNRSAQHVPTEYNNISLDKNGFIYATISALEDQDIWDGTATPVRKLNSMGTDILIRNGSAFPMGDLSWGSVKNYAGASKFVDVIAFNNDTYCCLDRTRGKIFAYDFQGNLLYAFGNGGTTRGRFSQAVSMDNMDEETILVLDGTAGNITEFSMTDYGKMINEALALYKTGYYDESAEVWKRILQFNGNFELAYIGIGRALLRKGEYKEAMGYFESAHDSENYSKAFRHYREQVVEKYIVYAVVVLIALIVIPKIIRKVRKMRKEIREA